jgi:hypothetical protein
MKTLCDSYIYMKRKNRSLEKDHKSRRNKYGRKLNNVKWHPCTLCDYKSPKATHLKRHKAYIHDIGVKWHTCTLCDQKFKADLKRHMANIHDIGVKWHSCTLCDQKFKGDLKRHMANIHDIGVKWHTCTLCDQKFKDSGHLKRHKANIHDIGVKWHTCTLCDYKSKGDLKRHMAYIHDIGVKWHTCTLCDQKFKKAGHLKRHMAFVHDIGVHKCGFCLCNRNSMNKYSNTSGDHIICSKCYRKVTGQTSRVETQWSEFVDEKIGKIGLLGSDTSLKSMSIGCSLKRPDRLYINANNHIELDECDERQHSGSNGDYTCDEKRLSEIYDSEQICGAQLIVIRWNPDSYKSVSKQKMSRKERMQLFVDVKLHLRENPPEDLIHVFYMFYSLDNPHICKNITVSHISSRQDLVDLQ